MPVDPEVQRAASQEVKVVRLVGFAKLDLPQDENNKRNTPTPLLDQAARVAPVYQEGMTRSASIAALLSYEIDRLGNRSPYKEWLPISLGVSTSKKYEGLNTTELREQAALFVGQDVAHFSRPKVGLESRGLEALTAQILADCFTAGVADEVSTGSTKAVESEAQPSLVVRSNWLRLVSKQPRYVLAVSLALIVIVVTSLLVRTSRDQPPSLPPPARAYPLIITQQEARSSSSSTGFAFDKTAGSEIGRAVEDVKRNGYSEGVVNTAVMSGAYYYGGMALSVNLRNNGNEEVTLFDVKPLVTHAPVANGTLFIGETGGASFTSIDFNLDQPHPIAMEHRTDTAATSRQYFSLYHPAIEPKDSLSILLFLNSYQTSAVFDLEFDYQMGTTLYRQRLTNGGHRYRVSAQLCGKDPAGRDLPANLRPLDLQLRFSGIYWQTFLMQERHQLARLDPQQYAATCYHYR